VKFVNPLLLPEALPPVPVTCGADEWDNIVRKWGVGYCCEWFGYDYDSEFTAETLRILMDRAAPESP
jgi:hypothetical protein